MSFEAGADIVRGDLDIFLTNSNSNPQNAADISYALYQVLPGPPEVEMILGSDTRTPINPAVGEYYASLKIPASAVPGTYRIRWRFKQLENTPYQTVTQEFDVTAVGSTSIVSPYSQDEQAMIDRLRILCRDDRPDQRYRFRPPEQSGRVGAYNRVFGQVFRDDELHAYLLTALDDWNAKPPFTTGMRNLNIITQSNPQWRTALYWGALAHAMFALTLNSIHDEFSVSGDAEVTVSLEDGELATLTLKELYDITHEES